MLFTATMITFMLLTLIYMLKLERVRNAFVSLWKEYEHDSSNSVNSCDAFGEDGSSSSNLVNSTTFQIDGLSRFGRFERWYKETRFSTSHAKHKYEVEQYLEN